MKQRNTMNRFILPAISACLIASCGGNKENPEARGLCQQAAEAFQSGDYTRATILLDSLQKNYPSEMAIQREAMALRPKVIEQLAQAKIVSVDSMTRADQAAMEQLKPKLKWVKTPGMIEGYWTDAKAYNTNFMNTTSIEARVSEIGQFYIVSSANPSSLRHTSVTLTMGDRSAATPSVPYDGESNYRIGGGEVITFSPEQSDTIGALATQALSSGTPKNISLTFNGDKGKKTVKLTQAQAIGIANAYRYSQAVIRARDNQVERQRLERTIEIARRQAAQAEARVTE